jgi:hypothetical protein
VAAENPTVVDRMLAKLRKFQALQPADGVAPYRQRDLTFRAPKDWRIPLPVGGPVDDGGR